MITSLDIKGLAVIDSLHINFSEGFNVITGETGAGKSILIKALSILLGTSKNPKESISLIQQRFNQIEMNSIVQAIISTTDKDGDIISHELKSSNLQMSKKVIL